MRRTRIVILIIACLIVSCLPVWAAGRTTPVEVMNTPLVAIDPNNSTVKAVQVDPWYMNILGTPNFNVANSPTVKIDGTTNTVKAAQSGTWNVGVSSMPTVNVNTHAVTQSGTWNVGINNTPNVNVTNTASVNVSNTPAVRIDASANAVDTPTRGRALLLFGGNQVIPTGAGVTSASFDCSGYSELRFIVSTDFAGSAIKAVVEFQSPLGPSFWGIALMRSLTDTYTAFSVPVYGGSCRLRITNNLGATATIWSESWVYMVN